MYRGPRRRETIREDATKADQTVRLEVDFNEPSSRSWDVEKGRNEVSHAQQEKTSKNNQTRGPRSFVTSFFSTRQLSRQSSQEVVRLISKTNSGAGLAPNHAWLHLEDDSITMSDFTNEALGMIADPEYRSLVGQLLRRVQKTSEKSFAHGRFLKPTTAVSNARDRSKRVTFFSLPYFSVEPQRTYNFDKHFPGHPVRSLMQSMYRLESTRQRDSTQIISQKEYNRMAVHVPDLWALMIGKRILITRSPTNLKALQGQTIAIQSFSKSFKDQHDTAVQLTDLSNNMYYIPSDLCQSYYEFVSHVVTRCLRIGGFPQEERNYRSSPSLWFYDESDNIIEEQSWATFLKGQSDNALLRLRLGARSNSKDGVKHKRNSQADQNAEIPSESDLSSDQSSRAGRSSSGYSSPRSRHRDETDGLADVKTELSDLYDSLEDAKTVDDYETIYAVESRQLPKAEAGYLAVLDRIYENNVEVPADTTSKATRRASIGNPSTIFDKARRLNKNLQRKTALELEMENRFMDVTSLSKGLSAWSSMTAVNIQKDSLTNSTSNSSSEEKEGLVDESIWKEHGRRNRRARGPHAQYIPSKEAVKLKVQQITPQTFSVQEYSLVENGDILVKAGASSIRVKKRLNEILAKAARLLERDSRGTPFFGWPVGLEVRVGTEDETTQDRQSPPSLDTQVATQRNMMTIVLDDIDRLCRLDEKRNWTSDLASKILYKRAPTKTLSDIEVRLEMLRTHLPESETLSNFRKMLFSLSKKILSFFVFQDIDDPVVGRYWGAIHVLLDNVKDEDQMGELIEKMLKIMKALQELQEGSLNPDRLLPKAYRIPRTLPKVFRDLTLFLIFYSASIARVASPDTHNQVVQVESDKPSLFAQAQVFVTYRRCRDSIQQSKAEIVVILSENKAALRRGNYDLVSGEDIAVLAISALQNQLITEQGDFYLTDLYAEYATRMVRNKMTSRERLTFEKQYVAGKKASVRRYDDINRFREEIEAIRAVLAQQYDKLGDLLNLFHKQPARIATALKDNKEQRDSRIDTIRHNMTDKLRNQIQQRLENFDDLLEQVDRIQTLAAQSISLKVESNNRAVLIFTLVTIIFLPLSFVTSYLGMNTSDIRDINRNQGLFWIIGAPLAVVVVLATTAIGYYERISQHVAKITLAATGTTAVKSIHVLGERQNQATDSSLFAETNETAQASNDLTFQQNVARGIVRTRAKYPAAELVEVTVQPRALSPAASAQSLKIGLTLLLYNPAKEEFIEEKATTDNAKWGEWQDPEVRREASIGLLSYDWNILNFDLIEAADRCKRAGYRGAWEHVTVSKRVNTLDVVYTFWQARTDINLKAVLVDAMTGEVAPYYARSDVASA
ncbi:uncharacterized protein KY384_000316 [Bacidia gigantensis]|uniref:uncharacterized protein n=1 Tax=Bacidia gigantensis TaxID=2732470 RepID=UPI001D037CD8|nr:uncharacterized protein KY384_000316 [Bacidia gigantensis]KAG8526323.1 hypothetical protein KY384_000316 [Bacidia gigantensis]